jgi:predicted MFS family arabinose efflux permease
MKATIDQVPVDRAPARAAPLKPATSFWILAAALFALMVAAAAPSPLYVVYQHRWHFSASTLTAVFAVYAIALLATLLTAGGLSDFLGRRPVLAVSLLIEVASMATFLTAHGVGQLLAARILQGIATGAATGAIGAGLVDLQPAHRPRLSALVNSLAPTVGLAVGALLTGLLVQYAPAPTILVFTLLLVAFLVLAAALVVVPETVARRPGALASLRPRATVPPSARREFLAATPAMVAAWAVGGLYLSLGPSLAAGVLGVINHVVGGLVVSTLAGAGAVAVLAMRDRTPRQMMTAGVTALAAGTALTLLAVALPSVPVFFAGTAVAGAGFGTTFLGSVRALGALAAPQQRAELFASMYLVSYLAFSVPALLAGLAVTMVGLTDTTIAYGGVVILFALTALALGRRRPAVQAATACPSAHVELGEAA